jgi:hypothetical protein
VRGRRRPSWRSSTALRSPPPPRGYGAPPPAGIRHVRRRPPRARPACARAGEGGARAEGGWAHRRPPRPARLKGRRRGGPHRTCLLCSSSRGARRSISAGRVPSSFPAPARPGSPPLRLCATTEGRSAVLLLPTEAETRRRELEAGCELLRRDLHACRGPQLLSRGLHARRRQIRCAPSPAPALHARRRQCCGAERRGAGSARWRG